MKIILPIFSVILLIFLFLFLYLFNRTLNIFPNCVYYNPKRDEPVIYLTGKVTDIQEKDNWFISNLELCNASLFGVAHVRIYTPKNETYFDVGGEIIHKGTAGYQWKKVSLDKFISIANKHNFLAVQVEELKTEEAVLALFKDLDGFDCQNEVICRNRLEFVKAQGPAQVNFLYNLKKRNFLPLFWDFVSGKAVVYSQKFGKVESLERFKQLTDSSLSLL